MSLYSLATHRLYLENVRRQEAEAERVQALVEKKFYEIMSCYVKNVKFMGITHNEQLTIFIDNRERYARKITKSSHTKFQVAYKAYNMVISVLETSQSS